MKAMMTTKQLLTRLEQAIAADPTAADRPLVFRARNQVPDRRRVEGVRIDDTWYGIDAVWSGKLRLENTEGEFVEIISTISA